MMSKTCFCFSLSSLWTIFWQASRHMRFKVVPWGSSIWKNTPVFSFLMIILAFLIGCSNENISYYISEADVVGTWKLTGPSHEFLIKTKMMNGEYYKDNPSYKYIIIFNTDGKCRYTTFLYTGMNGKYIDVEGKWFLEHDTMGNSNIEKKNAIRIEFKDNDDNFDTTRYYNVMKENKKIYLWEYFGEDDYIRYEKMEKK